MIGLTILAGLPVAVLGLWLLTETVRSHRSRWWLALVLPALLAWPIGTYVYGQSMLGYSVDETLSGKFVLIHAFSDQERQAVYALVRRDGETEPRLYVLRGDFEKTRKGFAAAQTKVDKGMAMAGRRRTGETEDDGDFVFYELPPAGVPAKD